LRSTFVAPQLIFELGDVQKLKEMQKIPDETLVVPDKRALAVFDLTERLQWTWGMLRQKIKNRAANWQDDLAKAFILAAENSIPSPITATFRIWDSGKIYRPVFYQADWSGESLARCHVLFNSETVPEQIASGPTANLFRLLLLSERFRAEISTPFLDRLTHEDGIQNPMLLFIQLRDSLHAIEIEEEKYGISEARSVQDLFDPEVGDDVRVIYDNWSELTVRLTEACQESGVDQVRGAIERARKALLGLDKLNSRLLRLSARRYARLLDDGSAVP
jgi:hypothetical protein